MFRTGVLLLYPAREVARYVAQNIRLPPCGVVWRISKHKVHNAFQPWENLPAISKINPDAVAVIIIWPHPSPFTGADGQRSWPRADTTSGPARATPGYTLSSAPVAGRVGRRGRPA